MEDRLATAWAALGSNAGPALDLEKLAVGGLLRIGRGLMGMAGRSRGALRAAPSAIRRAGAPVLARGAQAVGAGVALAPIAMRGLSHVAPAARQVAAHAPGAAAHGSRGLAFVEPKPGASPVATGLSPQARASLAADANSGKSLFQGNAPDNIGTQGSGKPVRRARNDTRRRRLVVPGVQRGGFGNPARATQAGRGDGTAEVQRSLDASLRGYTPAPTGNRGMA